LSSFAKLEEDVPFFQLFVFLSLHKVSILIKNLSIKKTLKNMKGNENEMKNGELKYER